jgi:hypothetical protein
MFEPKPSPATKMTLEAIQDQDGIWRVSSIERFTFKGTFFDDLPEELQHDLMDAIRYSTNISPHWFDNL